MLIIFRGNDNVIEFDAAIQADGVDGLLRDQITGALIAAATVEVTLTDTAGTDIGGETWPLSMPAVGGEPGNYRATLSDALVLVAEQEVVGVLTADNGPGARAEWNLRVAVNDRFN